MMQNIGYAQTELTTVQENILPFTMRMWGSSTPTVGNGGTVEINGEDATFKTNGPTGFAYLSLNINSVIFPKREICISMEVRSENEKFNANNIVLSGTYSIASGKTVVNIPKATTIGNRVGMRFILNSVGGVGLRIGIDALGSGAEGENRTLIVRKLVIEEINPVSPSRQCYMEGLSAGTAIVRSYRSDVSFSEASQDYGKLTFTKIYTQHVDKYALGFIVGDSFSIWQLSPIGWVNRIRFLRPDIAFYSVAQGGAGLLSLSSYVTRDLLTDFPQETDQSNIHPTFAIVQGGINDVITGTFEVSALHSMIRNMETILTTIKQRGIEKIIVVNIAPFSNHVNYALAKGYDSVIQRYNAWLRDYAVKNKYEYVDIYKLLKDDVNASALSLTYDSGDGLHPNEAGYNLIASEIITKYDKIISQ